MVVFGWNKATQKFSQASSFNCERGQLVGGYSPVVERMWEPWVQSPAQQGEGGGKGWQIGAHLETTPLYTIPVEEFYREIMARYVPAAHPLKAPATSLLNRLNWRQSLEWQPQLPAIFISHEVIHTQTFLFLQQPSVTPASFSGCPVISGLSILFTCSLFL